MVYCVDCLTHYEPSAKQRMRVHRVGDQRAAALGESAPVGSKALEMARLHRIAKADLQSELQDEHPSSAQRPYLSVAVAAHRTSEQAYRVNDPKLHAAAHDAHVKAFDEAEKLGDFKTAGSHAIAALRHGKAHREYSATCK